QEKLTWKGSNNAYSFPELLDQQPTEVGMMRMRPYDREKWKTFTGETDGKFVEAVKFAEAPDSDDLPSGRAEQFAAAELKGYGAAVDQLPAPAALPKRRDTK